MEALRAPYLVTKGEDPVELGRLRGQLKGFMDESTRIQSAMQTGVISFAECMEMSMEELMNMCPVKDNSLEDYYRAHPVAYVVAKVLFGPKKYESIPHINEIPTDEYKWVQQYRWKKNVIGYHDMSGNEERRLIHFKSAKHPIVKTDNELLIQFSVSDKLKYIFCETLVLEKAEHGTAWSCTGRWTEPDFMPHYGEFDHYTPNMMLRQEPRVDSLRKLIHEGELAWHEGVVLRLGFEAPVK